MFADRLNNIAPFRVMEVLARAAELEALGHRVVHLEVGEPDFVTSAPIVKAGQKALESGHTKYTQATGIPELREAIAAHYLSFGVQVAPERIIITAGASGGLTLLAALLLNPEDEMLITDPGYPCNEVFTMLAGATPKPMVVSPNAGFQPTVDDVDAAWSEKTKGILLASPANPTGTMLESDTMSQIASFVASRDGFFILDEIYQGLVHKESYKTGLQVTDRLFILNSFSKYFGMTGWRLGWVVVPEVAVDPITRLAQNLFICPSAPAQYAALEAFSSEALAVHESRAQEFEQRCARLYQGLTDLGFRIPVQPQGAFYLFVDVSHLGMGSQEFCRRLLDEHFVAVTPGADFGEHYADQYVRFAYTTSLTDIELALERIRDALEAWR